MQGDADYTVSEADAEETEELNKKVNMSVSLLRKIRTGASVQPVSGAHAGRYRYHSQ